VPFEVPVGWVWKKISDIANSIQYGYTGSAISTGKYKMLRITDIQDNSVDWETVPFVKIDDKKAENYLLSDNDIVFARTGATVGKSFLIKKLSNKSVFASYLIRIQLKEKLNAQYVKYFFESGYYWEQIEDKSVGTGQPNVNGTLLGKLQIPIPSLTEQHRIVQKIEECFTLIDQIEESKLSLSQFIKQTKSKVLDLAIRGKLVPQDPSDEPASVLLEKVKNERSSKKIAVDSLHYPFEIPKGWVWVRFCEISVNRDGERKPISSVKRKKLGGIYDYYGASGIIDKIDNFLFDEKLLLIGEDGANLITRSKPIAFFADGKYWVNNHAHVIDAADKRILSWLYYYVNAINLEKYVTGSAQPKLTQDNLNKILVPLPPKSEQHRIVSKIEQIFAQLDEIEKAIKAWMKKTSTLLQ